MDFFLMTEPQLGGSYQDLARAARQAEEAGLAGFARSDHYYWSRGEPRDATDAFTSLAGLAIETTRVRLTVLVSPITFRHPAVIAKSSATLDQMSGGRFDLGVGTGWMEEEHRAFGIPFPAWKERFSRLEESLQYLRAAFGGEAFEGQFYRLEAQVLPRPEAINLIVGGSGPEKTPALAGRYADEYNQFAANPADLAPRIARMKEAASEAGRDPDSIVVSLMGPAVLATSEKRHTMLMEEAASFRNLSVDELTTRWEKAGIPMGTPDQAGAAFAAFEEIGVSRYYVQRLELNDYAGLEETIEAISVLNS